jgi:glycosyltransferase involved in cell wall biosynthesis
MTAHRYYRTEYIERLVLHNLEDISNSCEKFLSLENPSKKDWTALRSLVLKNPKIENGQIEKGVFLVKFSNTLPFIINDLDCDTFLKWFWLVIEPSSSNYCAPELLFWAKYKKTPIIIQASEVADFEFLEAVKRNLIPVSYGSSDWVDDRIFAPVDCTKDYDAIFVASYNVVKRHHRFFEAVNKLKEHGFKVAMVCTPFGSWKNDVHNLLKYYGIIENVDIYEGIPPTELASLMCRSKVNVLLSLKEGSNRSIFEGFFTGTPGVVLKENIGVNKTYINEQTGLLIDDSELEETLYSFMSDAQSYEPFEWASKNITPQKTTQKLNEHLRQIAIEAGEKWTTNIIVKVNSPEATYYNKTEGEKMLPVSSVKAAFSKKNPVAEEERHSLLGLLR